jgi:YedE family putative selenium metabolism protein
MGSIRDVILMRDTHLISGVGGLLVAAFVMNLILGQFHPGVSGQPVAHSNHIWNFLGMVLAGLAFALAGGCPGRQLFMAGEGDGDAGVFVLGMLVGAAFAHNFSLAARPDSVGTAGGPSPWGMAAVVVGLVVCVVLGFAMREKYE